MEDQASDRRQSILVVLGTRPEAVKLAPVIRRLRVTPGVRLIVCTTGQHPDLLPPVLDFFGITPDHDLVMTADGSLAGMTAALLARVTDVLERERPDRVVVQGDTTSAMAAGLAAFYRRVPLAHVEAGLRTGDSGSPFPEELNRRVLTLGADLHFAPTSACRRTLLAEGVRPDRVLVTGNTVVDAFRLTLARTAGRPDPVLDALPAARRRILVTTHRRENLGAGVAGVCAAVRRLLARHPDLSVVMPVHPNPRVGEHVRAELAGVTGVTLLPPLSYPSMVRLLVASHLVLTDSGGLQEEATVAGRPVLVLRDTTERSEAVAAGAAVLVGTDPDRVVGAVDKLLRSPRRYRAMAAAGTPYGDGRAADRIVDALLTSAARTPAATVGAA